MDAVATKSAEEFTEDEIRHAIGWVRFLVKCNARPQSYAGLFVGWVTDELLGEWEKDRTDERWQRLKERVIEVNGGQETMR